MQGTPYQFVSGAIALAAQALQMLQMRDDAPVSASITSSCYLWQSYSVVNYKKRTLCERTSELVEFAYSVWLYLPHIGTAANRAFLRLQPAG